MARPDRYYVQWDATRDPDTSALDLRMRNVGEDKAYALRIAEGISRTEGVCVQVVERTNIQDVTPLGDPPGLIWDWDEDFDNVEEVFVS